MCAITIHMTDLSDEEQEQFRKKLLDWLGENKYKAAYLQETLPMAETTFYRVKSGGHKPPRRTWNSIIMAIERYEALKEKAKK